jgi:DNA-binding transcriptional MerR regulator
LRFIRSAQVAGFTLEQIAELIALELPARQVSAKRANNRRAACSSAILASRALIRSWAPDPLGL